LDCERLGAELTPAFELIPAADVTDALDLLERSGGIEGVITARQIGSGPGGIELLAVVNRHHPELARVLVAEDRAIRYPMLDLGLAHAVVGAERAPGQLLEALRQALRDTQTPSARAPALG
jgi:hypothetical protein